MVGFRQGRCPPQASFLLGATSSGFCALGGQGHPSFSPGPGAMPAHSRQILTHNAAMQKAMFPGLRCLGCRSLGRVQGHGCRAERPLYGHSHVTSPALLGFGALTPEAPGTFQKQAFGISGGTLAWLLGTHQGCYEAWWPCQLGGPGGDNGWADSSDTASRDYPLLCPLGLVTGLQEARALIL